MPDWPALRDYSRSRAVVMGTWDYEFLEPVPAARTSMERMRGLLTGPLCGWPAGRLVVAGNERTPGDLPDRLVTAFEDARDVALFYFVGHGQIAPDDQLCLGLGLSRPEPGRRAVTSLRFSDVRQALQDSGAAVKIVILDCCFAGLAAGGSLAGVAGEVLDLTAGTGAYTMAATSAYATAWYEHGPGLAAPQTYFTRYLVDLVEEGIAGEPAQLRLDGLYRRLRDSLAADRRPVPRSRAVNDARDFAFAHNAAPAHTHRDPEREIARLTRRLAEAEEQLAAASARVLELERTAAARKRAAALEREAAARRREAALARLRERPTAPGTAAGQDVTPEAAGRPGAAVPQVPSGAPAVTGAREFRGSDPVPPGTLWPLSAAVNAAIVTAAAIGIALAFILSQSNSPAVDGPIAAIRSPIAALPGSGGAAGVSSLAFGPADALAVGYFDGSTEDWGVAARRVTAALPSPGAPAGASSVAFGPADTLAVGSSSGSTYVWDIPARRITAKLSDPAVSEGVSSVAFGPAGILAVGSNDGITYIWDIPAQRITAKLSDPAVSEGVSSVAFGPAGILAVGDRDGSTYVWDIRARRITATLPDPQNATSGVESVAFGPRGILAAGDGNGSTYIWDIPARRITAEFPDPGNPGSVSSVSFGPRGALAAGSNDGTTYLWDVLARRITAEFPDPGNSGGVTSVAFEPGGIVATGDSDGTTYLWKT